MNRFRLWLDEQGQRLLALLAGLVEGIEFAFHSLAALLRPWTWFRTDQEVPEEETTEGGWTDSFESRFDGVLYRIGWLLPWRWRRGPVDEEEEGEPTDGGVIDSLESMVERFFLALFPNRWVEKLEGLPETEEPKGAYARVSYALRQSEVFLIVAALDMFDFIGEWWWSRNRRKLLWAIPALLLTVPTMSMVALVPLYSRDGKIKHYRAALLEASERSDKASETLILRKLTELGYQRQDHLEYQRAMAIAKEGDLEKAYEIMKTIAPETEPRYLYAHIWIAGVLLEGRLALEDHWRIIEQHARCAHEINEFDPLVQRLAVEVHLHHGRTEEANKLMLAHVGAVPSYHATLMANFRDAGDELAARKHAHRAITFFEQEDPAQVSALGYLRWSEAHALLKQDDKQRQVLDEAHQRYPDDAALAAATSARLQAKLAEVTLDQPNAAQALLRILCERPNHRGVWQLLMDGFAAEDPHLAEVVARLRAAPDLPAKAHKLLGDIYFQRAEYQQALASYERTCELDSEAAAAFNNIAWLRGHVEPVDLAAALEAANKAIARDPDARFFETRGQLHMKRRAWLDAVRDLERAANGKIPDVSAVHRSLALAYQELGNSELSAAHRSLADSN